jgi:RNA polymerase sigma-70 factor (ECF subfamily)
MLRVQAGDAFAFEQLMQRYHGRLVRILRHQVGGSDDSAEDLAQDVFLRVFRARASYLPTAKFSTWLYHIAHNVASNAHRDRKRRKEVQAFAPTGSQSSIISLDQMAMASTGEMPVRRFDKVERAEMVRLAVDALSDRQRMALLLNKFEGLSYQEIAEAMELSVQAVKSLLSRARVNLKQMLEPYVSMGQADESEPLEE